MASFKWADVAHYYKYVEHEVLVSHKGTENNPLRRVSESGEDLGIYYHRPDLVRDGFATAPILRHRDDMTEAEALQILNLLYKMPLDGCLASPKASLNDKMGTKAGIVSHLDISIGEPKVWHWLISKGFDVFGLIESGQAIRKETKPDTRTESHC